MTITFLSPLAALAGLAVAIPLVAALLRERRHAEVLRSLRIGPPPRARLVAPAAALTVAFGLLAAAAAQPVVRVESEISRRTDAEAYVLIDTTRSMLAARVRGGKSRIERAMEAAVEIREALPDVPFGVGSITNRPLPHLFPGVDARQFDLVVREAVGVNRPPASKGGLFGISTDFQSIEAVASDNWFSPPATKRLVVLLSDGESDPYAVRHLLRALGRAGVDLVIVRFWRPDERVWRANGSAEPYRPGNATLDRLTDLAALTTGRRVYGEGAVGAAVAAARAYLGQGPVVSVAAPGRTVSLAPHAVLAACIALLLLLVPVALEALSGRREARPTARRERIAYSMLAAWFGSSRTSGRRSRRARGSPRRSSSAPRSSTGASSPGSA